MSQKIALVTGATSGIGLGIAGRLADGGYRVLFNGLGSLETILKAQEAISPESVHYSCDMTKPDDIEKMIAQIHRDHGSIDILVNNAGMQFVSPIEDFPVDKWDAIIALDLSAAFHTTRLVLREMKEKKWGRIVNIASAHALVGSPFKSAYVAAKHGLAGLTKVTALEAAAFGVTCNAICPGYVKTPLVENQIADTAKARGITPEEVVQTVMLGNQPTKQFVTIDQVAELTTYLVSERAASITGACLAIDGGWTSH